MDRGHAATRLLLLQMQGFTPEMEEVIHTGPDLLLWELVDRLEDSNRPGPILDTRKGLVDRILREEVENDLKRIVSSFRELRGHLSREEAQRWQHLVWDAKTVISGRSTGDPRSVVAQLGRELDRMQMRKAAPPKTSQDEEPALEGLAVLTIDGKILYSSQEIRYDEAHELAAKVILENLNGRSGVLSLPWRGHELLLSTGRVVTLALLFRSSPGSWATPALTRALKSLEDKNETTLRQRDPETQDFFDQYYQILKKAFEIRS